MADISKITVKRTTYSLKDIEARQAIANLTEEASIAIESLSASIQQNADKASELESQMDAKIQTYVDKYISTALGGEY